MKNEKKLRPAAALLALLLAFATSCQNETGNESGGQALSGKDVSDLVLTAVEYKSPDIDVSAYSDVFNDTDFETVYTDGTEKYIKFDGQKIEYEQGSVSVDKTDITITEGGTYILSGTLSGGMIIIDTENRVNLIFDGVSINCTYSAPLYVRAAKKVTVTLAEGTENVLSSGGKFNSIDENNIDGTVFSKDDICFNGKGKLTVSSPAGHGIVGKDDLKIVSGTYVISSYKTGISANDSIRLGNPDITITSRTDGLKATNDKNDQSGYIFSAGATININSQRDGINAGVFFRADGGKINIVCGSAMSLANDTKSRKGIKASGYIEINGGEFNIEASDDAINAMGDITINGGQLTLLTADDALHSDQTLRINGGNLFINKCFEGLEGLNIEISGGYNIINSSGDGMNAAGGGDESGYRKDDGFGTANENYIKVTGGITYVNAYGDGIDANGSIYMEGGLLCISGPVNDGDSPLDYNTAGYANGGIFIAAACDGMAMNFNSAKNQGAIMFRTGRQNSNSDVCIKDGEGTELIRWTAPKAYECIIISIPSLVSGKEYTISAGRFSKTFTLEELIYGN